MFPRTGKVLRVLLVILGIGGLTWIASWGAQYLCVLTIEDQQLTWGDTAANKLATITVGVTVVIALVYLLAMYIIEIWGLGWVIGALLITLGLLSNGAEATYDAMFPSTVVSTGAARTIYWVGMCLWSITIWRSLGEDLADLATGKRQNKL